MSTCCSTVPLQGRIGNDRRHCHHLFRQLCIAHNGAHRNVLRQDLGHFDSLLRNRQKRVEELEHVWQLFHHLRRRIVESRQRGEVDDLLNGAPLYPFLRSGHGKKQVRPRPAGLFFKAEELRLGAWGSRIMAVSFISRPHTPALAIVCPREEWCVLSARAIATVIRSCRNMERSRRSLCRRATPLDEGRPLGSAIIVQRKPV